MGENTQPNAPVAEAVNSPSNDALFQLSYDKKLKDQAEEDYFRKNLQQNTQNMKQIATNFAQSNPASLPSGLDSPVKELAPLPALPQQGFAPMTMGSNALAGVRPMK
jgi:hypothetical protein